VGGSAGTRARSPRAGGATTHHDIDVLDPSIAPGTGAPEPGGITVTDLLAALRHLAAARVVGFDLVEVSPRWDPSGRTAITAAAIARDAILTWWPRR
jgi:arginase family enzyme